MGLQQVLQPESAVGWCASPFVFTSFYPVLSLSVVCFECHACMLHIHICLSFFSSSSSSGHTIFPRSCFAPAPLYSPGCPLFLSRFCASLYTTIFIAVLRFVSSYARYAHRERIQHAYSKSRSPSCLSCRYTKDIPTRCGAQDDLPRWLPVHALNHWIPLSGQLQPDIWCSFVRNGIIRGLLAHQGFCHKILDMLGGSIHYEFSEETSTTGWVIYNIISADDLFSRGAAKW